MIRDLDALYRAENKHAEQLPQLASRAKSDTLPTAFPEHTGETRQQIDRLG
jgi:ferritin-like metal-binding protein YciE